MFQCVVSVVYYILLYIFIIINLYIKKSIILVDFYYK